jgi:alanine-glyoxylate transaminase/serine-glyoxylate transaminase/serine-pyruvate transaminase
MQDLASRLGAEVEVLEFEWGRPVETASVEQKLDAAKYKIVAVVHAETSTGVRNPVEEIGQLVNKSGALFLVDTVTSLAGIPVEADRWGVDAMYSGTQKCLSCPPGLAPVTFSGKAVDTIRERKNKVPNWYLDMTMIMNYWEGKKRVYHHTAPVNMIYGLYQALLLFFEEGPEKAFDRHATMHHRLVAGIEKMGLEMLVEKQYRLPMLNTVKIPEGVDDASVRARLRNEYDIEIGAGLGPLAGKVWRVGLMGHTAREGNVDRFLSALAKLI